MRTDGRTDTTKLIIAFRNFAKAPTNTSYKNTKNSTSNRICKVKKKKEDLKNNFIG